MALVDPNIAMGYRGIEMPNQLAQYGQLAAIQNAQNQNSLAQYQLSSAQRADEQQNNLYAAARQPGFKLDFSTAIQYGPAGVAAFKAQEDAAGTALTRTKTQGDIDAAKFKLKKDQLDFGWNAVGSAPTAQDAIEKINQGVKDGHFDMKSATQDIQRLQSMTSPEDYQKYRIEKILGLVDAKDKLGFMLPKNVRQDIGGKIVTMQDNPMLPGYSQPVSGMDITKTQTFADITAAKQATTSAGQLNLAREKFAFEQANPGMTIQEDANGLLAINNRTGVAIPVVYGQTGFQPAPAATPAAAGPSVMRQQGAGMPGQRLPAIPGMTSVLDQTAAPAAAMPRPSAEGMRVAGQPVGSKKEAPAKFNDTDMQLAGLAGSLKEFKEEVGKNLFTGAKFLPSGADTSRMTAKYTALLMGVKDLYTLGALTGPDMSIIESQLTNPASWSGKIKFKEGFDEQVKVIEDMLKRSTTNLETTYGRVPKASRKALEGLPGGASGGISGASANDPLGLLGVPQ